MGVLYLVIERHHINVVKLPVVHERKENESTKYRTKKSAIH